MSSYLKNSKELEQFGPHFIRVEQPVKGDPKSSKGEREGIQTDVRLHIRDAF